MENQNVNTAFSMVSPSDALDAELSAEVGKEKEPEGRRGQLQHYVERLLRDARSFVDGELSPARAKLASLYNTDPLGNEVPGRSKVQSPDIRDVIQGMLPSLLRVLCGPDAVVEVNPQPGREALAKQQTGYLNHIFFTDNPGYRNTHAVLKDGLLKRLGAYKVWWEEKDVTEGWRVSGLTQEDIDVLTETEGMTVEITSKHPAEGSEDESGETPEPGEKPSYGSAETGEEAGPEAETAPEQAGEMVYDAKVFSNRKEGRVRILSLNPEEVWYNRSARDHEEASLIAHVQWRRKSDLIAEGADEADLEDVQPEPVVNAEAVQRNPHLGGPQVISEESEDTTKALYAEVYIRWAEKEGDPPVMTKVCCVGPSFKIIGEPEPAERGFFFFVPDPDPHSITGLGIADYVETTQLVKTAVSRAILDSANQAIRHRTWGVEGKVSLADIQNEEMGAHVRTKGPAGEVFGEFVHTFIGKDLLPLLAYFDDKTERSTGQSNGAQGLDPDSLQSATETAVTAQITQSQQHLEMIARLYAETCLKPMFRYILRLIVEHQDRPRLVRMFGTYVNADPRSWDTDLDFTLNVALGTNSTQHKLGVLGALAAKQEFILTSFPSTPLAMLTLPAYARTLNQIAAIQGFAEGEFFPTDKDIAAQAAQAAQQPPPPPSPEQIIAQTQQQKMLNTHEEHVMDAHLKVAALDLKRQTAAAQDQRERQKIAISALEKGAQVRVNERKTSIDAAHSILQHHAAVLPKVTGFDGSTE
jgi:hypothetical protein